MADPAGAPQDAGAPVKRRDPWFDNAKMALVTLVVVGHSWRLLPHNSFDSHLYDFLYAWHVPAFVFVTGYLSRSFSWRRDRMWQLVRTTVVPYLIFEWLLAVFRMRVGGEEFENLFLNPHWPMWFLAALFFWRLLTPLFRVLGDRLPAGPVAAVALAVLVSLLGGFWGPDTFDLARTMGFLPFFVLGLQATPERLERLRTRRARTGAVLVFLGIAGLTFATDRLASTEWLFYRAPYAELEDSDARALLVRAGLLVVGALGSWAFLALVPRSHGWFTRMGQWTLVVYLCHGFPVRGAEYAGYPDWTAAHPVLAPPVTTLLAIGIALVLAWEPVATRLGHLVDPFAYAERRVTDALDLAAAARALAEHPIATDPTPGPATDVTEVAGVAGPPPADPPPGAPPPGGR